MRGLPPLVAVPDRPLDRNRMKASVLVSVLERLDPDMDVRIVGNGTVEATYLAISRDAQGENYLILSATKVDGLPVLWEA